LQLVHPLYLHGQVTTDLYDLAFNGIRQLGVSAPPRSSRRGTNGFRHGSPQAHPVSLDARRMYRLERTIAFNCFSMCVTAALCWPPGPSAEGQGFNVNIDVTFTPFRSIKR